MHEQVLSHNTQDLPNWPQGLTTGYRPLLRHVCHGKHDQLVSSCKDNCNDNCTYKDRYMTCRSNICACGKDCWNPFDGMEADDGD